MSTIWGHKRPNDSVMTELADTMDDGGPVAIMVGVGGIPDAVRLPLAAGGTEHRVAGVHARGCVDPLCQTSDPEGPHTSPHMTLTGSEFIVCLCRVQDRWTIYALTS